MNELDTLVQQAQALFAQCASAAELENAKAQFLGKSGRISEMMKGLSQLDLDAKKTQGAVINLAKQSIEQALNARRQALADEELNQQLQAEKLDVSLPSGLRKAAIEIDRKMLADLAVHDKAAFGHIVDQVKARLAA